MKQQTRGSLMLLLCAMVWGAAFVAQSEGMNYVGPFTMRRQDTFSPALCLYRSSSCATKRESPSARPE